MGRGDGVETSMPRPGGEEAIALLPSAFLNRAVRFTGPLDGEDLMRDAQTAADRCNHIRFIAALGPQSVIDGRGFNSARPDARGKEQ